MAKASPRSTSPIPRNLRRLRQEAGLTQADLAQAADVADATISRIERNRFLPSQDLLNRLAEALGVDAAELVRRSAGAKKSALRASEAKLLAVVRRLDDGQVDDITRAIRLLLAVGRRST